MPTDYALQFARNANGKITWTTELGKWMFFALKLHKPQHAIIWNLEQLDMMIDEIESILENKPDTPIKDELLNIYRKHRYYINQLRQSQ